MLNTFEKTKAHEARRAAIQRQMEAMEAAATSRNPDSPGAAASVSSQTGTTRRRAGGAVEPQAQGSLETARRFLWDEDEEDAAGAKPAGGMTKQAGAKGDDRRNLYSTDPNASRAGFFASIGSLFGGGGKSAAARPAANPRATAAAAGSGEGDNYRPSVLTSCYIFFRRFMLRLALTMGSCYTWMRTRWAMAMGNGRGRRLCLVISVILVVVIPVIIFAPGTGGGDGSSGGSRSSSLSASKRYDMIQTKIVQSGISAQTLLGKSNSPQQKALNWIVAEDPAQLDPDDKFVLPRYSLAVFYFSTHGSEMFQVATINITQTIPPAGAEEEADLGVGEIAKPVVGDGETTTMGDDLAAQPNWVHESGWLSGQGYCTWYGVECHHRDGTSIYSTRYDDNNGLILLNMTENNVRGKIPREVFLANPDIRWFSLGGNGFFGEIPAEIGTLSQMRYLSLANNFFTGSLPNSISQMKILNRLYVDGNYFAGKLPAGLGGMTDLETLSIYNNFFSGTLTSEIGMMKNMTALYLDINHLSGSIPTEISTLKLLGDLRLRHNRFTGPIPDDLGMIPDLEILYLDRNTLTGTIPTSLGQATRLTEMHLYRNKLKGAIPSQIGQLKELNSLYLDNNHLTGGIPTEFADLGKLEQIYMHKNYMNGTIPSELGKMENLADLRIYTNGFVGTIPPELANAWKLENIYLQDNVLSGPVPESIGELTRLQKLRLYWNRFDGTVPKKICDLMEFRLTEFKTDCAGDTPKLQCECCTACFA